jgi:hypothetical protein
LVECLAVLESLQDFAGAVKGFTPEQIEDAIASQDTQHHRQLLKALNDRRIDAEELAEAFQFCNEPELFASVAEGYESSKVEDAIAVQGTQTLRQQLREWFKAGAGV